MHCHHARRTRTPRPTIRRSQQDKVFFGVCGGLGEHFNVSSNWIRVGFIVGSVLTSGVVPVVYLICIFAMPTDRLGTRPITQATSSFRNRAEAFDHLDNQFDQIEEKIRQLEDHVTSKEYVLKRKFEEL